jgi:anti-sigma factor RsiW
MSHQEQNRWDEKGTLGQEAHPPPELLLLCLDGELPSEEAARVLSHLEACWVCRTQTSKIESTIVDFVDYHQAMLVPHLTPPQHTWRNFDAKLDRRAEAVEDPSWLSRAGSRLRVLFAMRTNGLQLAAVLVLVVAAIAGLDLFRGRRVSASELLQRSARAENARLEQIADPVVYRKLQVRRRSAQSHDSIGWELWNPSDGSQAGRFRQRVSDTSGLRFLEGIGEEPEAPAVITDLKEIFRVNRLDAERPISADGYTAWRTTVRVSAESITEQVLPDGVRGLKLTTIAAGPHTANQILEASITVRQTDWRPVIEQLSVQGEKEIIVFELIEVAYEVLPLSALTVSTDPGPPPATPSPSPRRTSPAAPPAPEAPSAAELQQAEVTALYTLHQARADLGEQIEIARDPSGRVLVRGMVEGAARKEELVEALSGLPLVLARIQTVEEAQLAVLQRAVQSPGQGSLSPIVSTPGASEQTIPEDPGPQPQSFRTALEKYFGGSSGAASERITELTNQSLALSESALARAWALKRLAENPSLHEIAQLTAENRVRLASMLKSHLKELREQTLGLRALLEPCLLQISTGGISTVQPPPQTSDWGEASLRTFRSVAQLDQKLHRMFNANVSIGSPTAAAREALREFVELEASLRALEDQTTQVAAEK